MTMHQCFIGTVATVDLTRTRRVPVSSLSQASRAVRAHIERPIGSWISSSRWQGGAVRDVQGRVLARISYNGRVWGLDDVEIVDAAVLS